MKEKDSTLVQFGNRIRELREAKGLSQEELADLGGIHRTYLGGIERGERNPTLLSLLKLAKALDTSPAKLLEGL
jgi:transcriptional regulator with XRE-family HTH domain